MQTPAAPVIWAHAYMAVLVIDSLYAANVRLRLSRCDQSDDTLSEPMDQVLTRRRGIARLTRWTTHRGPGRLRTRALTETPTLRG
ncbi:hypothetical protein P5V15_011326 [Pogonomyrmex californicus]